MLFHSLRITYASSSSVPPTSSSVEIRSNLRPLKEGSNVEKIKLDQVWHIALGLLEAVI
jgi:hypothetical protein